MARAVHPSDSPCCSCAGASEARLSAKRCFGLLAAVTAILVVGRLISGVHWLSDILGGVFLSAGLVLLYAFICPEDSPSNA